MDAYVWHVRDDLSGKDGRSLSGGFSWGAEALMFPRDFSRVAAVTPPDDRWTVELGLLGYVFEMTNHIDHDWTENSCVRKLGNRHRSTSVGDVVQFGAKYYIVMPSGFAEIQGNTLVKCNDNKLVEVQS